MHEPQASNLPKAPLKKNRKERERDNLFLERRLLLCGYPDRGSHESELTFGKVN